MVETITQHHIDFGLFSSYIKKWVEEAAKADVKHQNRRANLVILDRDTKHEYYETYVDVFYGATPLGPIVEHNGSRKFIVASGGSLRYNLIEDGRVMVSISPRKSENLSVIEKGYLLTVVKTPKALLSSHAIKKHWSLFSSYIEVTATEGHPSIGDKIKVSYIRWVLPEFMGKTFERRKLKKIIKFLLYLVPVALLIMAVLNYFIRK